MPVLIGIGIDYGVTGAAVAIGPRRGADGPHRLAVRHAHGRGGYYAGGRAGSLDVRIARHILQLIVEEVTPGRPPARVFVVIEALQVRRSQSVQSTRDTARDHGVWCAAVQTLDYRLATHATARGSHDGLAPATIEQRAGFKRRTVGRKNRKAEIGRWVDWMALGGQLPADVDLVPPGGRVVSDGATDATLHAWAALRIIGGAK